MNSEPRNEQELADETVEVLESGGPGVVDRDAAMTHELGRRLRELPNDDATEADRDLRARLSAQFGDGEKVVASEGVTKTSSGNRSKWSRVWIVAASLLVLGTLAGMLLPAVQQVREAARRTTTMESKINPRDSSVALLQDHLGQVDASKPKQAIRGGSDAPGEKLPSAFYLKDDVQYGAKAFAYDEGSRTFRSNDQVVDDLLDLAAEPKPQDGQQNPADRLAKGFPDAEDSKSEKLRRTKYRGSNLAGDTFGSQSGDRRRRRPDRLEMGMNVEMDMGMDMGLGDRSNESDSIALAIREREEIRKAAAELAYTKDLLTQASNEIVEIDPTMRFDGSERVDGSQSESDQYVHVLKEVRNQFEDRYVAQQETLRKLLSQISAPMIVGGQTIHHVKIAELGRKIEKAKQDLVEATKDKDRVALALQSGEEKKLLWALTNEGKVGADGTDDLDRFQQAIETRLLDLEIARVEMVERYGPRHPRSKSVDRQLAHFREKLEGIGKEKNGLEVEGLGSKEALKLYEDALDRKIAENQELIRTSMEQYAIHEAEAWKIRENERQINEAREKLTLLKERLRAEAGISNAEQYEPIVENQFVAAMGGDAVSTFAIDVDTASYANTRRFINNGVLPPPNAVRLEELINYFSYDYQQPKGDDPFSVNLELAGCPWNEDHQLLRIGLQGKDVHVSERPPTNVVFLIDVSGSMQDENKLPLLKRGFQMMVDQLGEDDRVSIVTYAGNAGVALNSISGDQKTVIKDAIEKLTPGGSTHGSAGIELAYQLAQQNFIAKGSNKVILATDGDLNVGVTNDNQLVDLIKGKAAEGVFLTVLGFGTGNLKDGKLEKLADNGNGVYSYIDSLREAHKVLVEQLSGSLLTIAKDVKIQIEFNPAEVTSYRLLGYENRALKTEDFDNDRKDAGEIGAGHSVTAIYELVPADSGNSSPVAAPVGLKYQAEAPASTESRKVANKATLTEAARSGDLATVAVRYKRPDVDASQRLEFTIANESKSFVAASEDFRFAASVAGFGMLLRGSAHAGDATLAMIERIASGAMRNDASGYRAEFVDLVRKASTISDHR